jgi:nickel-dependent lactate racemase
MLPPDRPILLGHGARPLAFPAGVPARVLRAPPAPPVPDLAAALQEALRHPIGARPLAEVASERTRVVVIVGHAGRRGPPPELFAAVRQALAVVPDDHLTVAIANGAHPPEAPDRLRLPAEVLRRHRLVNHDAHDEASLVDMGRTSRDTHLRVNRCVAEADLVVVTGVIRPHCFAGWSGGSSGIFPGLGHHEDIRQTRRLGADPEAMLGRADANPCREDLEEAARRLGRDTYAVDVIEVGETVVGAVAGDVVYAHREGVRLARPWCEASSARADVVVVSAPLPVTATLAQATALLPAAGLLLRDGGAVILCAECPEGTGPLELVSERIEAVRRYLPERHALLLVSSLPEATVRETAVAWAPDLDAALAKAQALTGRKHPEILALPDAADLVPLPLPDPE